MAEYICREDVLKKAKSSISVPVDNEWDCGYNAAMAEMQEFIKRLPSADVQPVKHGKWDGYICSECNVCADYFISGDFYFDEKPNFCPNCGARMDLDSVAHDRCSNYMDCDGSCFIDDTPCDCDGNIEKCKGR